tara:strand:- start:174 stop:368 length:195 start_codon:yes stop_codon:yes gene_type:complete
MIKVNSLVRLKINNDQWIGKVVEMRDEIALIHLMDNMHYHAKLEELELLTVPTPLINAEKKEST